MKLKLIKKNKGFALLFSVLISSLLLTIGLSIFNIALKELAISTASRQSIHAFFAADSGREYVLYHDIKLGDILPVDTNTQSKIKTSTTTRTSPNTPVSDTDGPNYFVVISKSRPKDSPVGDITTTIKAYGYNSNSDDRLERAIEQTY